MISDCLRISINFQFLKPLHIKVLEIDKFIDENVLKKLILRPTNSMITTDIRMFQNRTSLSK